MSNIKGNYINSNNFIITDSIGVPHPYVITHKHVAEASDNHSGMLGESAIISCENKGITCGMKGCQLSFKEHEQALIIECLKDPNESDEISRELNTMLKFNVSSCEKNGYAGFTFLKKFKE